MSPEIIWLNGEIIPTFDARIGIEDRGFQFADGVYEVIRIYNGQTFTLAEHLERLNRSAESIKIRLPLATDALAEQIRKYIALAKTREGMVYLQLTRGVSERAHVIPAQCKPTLLFYTTPLPPAPIPGEGEGVKLLAVADERWKRCWVKSIALLPNVLAKSQAVDEGYDEAAFVDHGNVTECAASNLFAVIAGKLVTHPVGSKVLPGITRAVLLDMAAAMEIKVDERPIREEEITRSSEVFITSTTREISWVARWNDRYIGPGRCGPITLSLHHALRERISGETIERAR